MILLCNKPPIKIKVLFCSKFFFTSLICRLRKINYDNDHLGYGKAELKSNAKCQK